jgi:hypothetical protein
LFVDSSGLIGAGAAPSIYRLDVTGNGIRTREGANSSALVLGTYDAGGYAYITSDKIGTGSYQPLAFFTNGSERLRLTTTGALNFVGAGTAGSTQAVSFNGSAPVNSLVIDSSGRVGLGTSSPAVRLHVDGTTAEEYMRVGPATGDPLTTKTIISSIYGDTATNGAGPGLRFWAGVTAAEIYGTRQDNGAGGALHLDVRTSGTLGTALYIDSSKRVGIGTTGPASELDVVGLIRGSQLRPSLADSAATPGLQVYNEPDTGFFRPAANTIGITVGGSEAARIDSSGRLLVGTNTARDLGGFSPSIFEGINASGSRLVLFQNSSNTSAGCLHLGKSRGASVGSNTIVEQNDELGVIRFNGADGTDSDSTGAEIRCLVDGTPGANDMPGRLVFSTTADGASSPTERMRIDSSGRVGIGTTAPGALLDLAASNDGATGTTANNTLRFTDTDANTAADQPLGKIEWYSADTSTPGARAVSYIMSAAAGTNSGGDIRFGISANAGTVTEAARIDSSGRLLVGTSTLRAVEPNGGSTSGATLTTHFEGIDSVPATLGIIHNGTATTASSLYFARSRGTSVASSTVVADGDILGTIAFAGADGTDIRTKGAEIYAVVDGTPGANDMPGRLVFSTTADGASSPTERMRITNSGTVYIGTTSDTYPNPGIALFSSGASQFGNNAGTAGFGFLAFSRSNVLIGSITQNGTTGVAYNTTSDYRLKENVVPLVGAIDRINQLEVRQFNFITEPERTVDGFIAHEAQTVVPEAVTGTKDEVDADGNPVYQGIDQSKLVPLLTAALQEAIGRIETLEAEVAALKGA